MTNATLIPMPLKIKINELPPPKGPPAAIDINDLSLNQQIAVEYLQGLGNLVYIRRGEKGVSIKYAKKSSQGGDWERAGMLERDGYALVTGVVQGEVRR